MFRLLIKILLLVIVLAVGTMIAVQWKLNKELEAFSDRVRPFVDFSYESAKVDYNGEVTLSDVHLFIEPFSTVVDIGQLTFQTGDNLLDLVMLKSNFQKFNFLERGHVTLTDVMVPLNDTLLRAIKTVSEYPAESYEVLNAAFCGTHDKFRVAELVKMGYDYIAFSSRDSFFVDKHSGSVVFSGLLSMEDMFELEYRLDIGGVISAFEYFIETHVMEVEPTNSAISPHLSFLDFKLRDAGYNLKQATYCAKEENVNIEDYYEGHVAKVSALLQDAGMEMSEDAKLGYLEALKPNSKVHLSSRPKATFDWEGIDYYTYEELMEQSGFFLSINDKPLAGLLDKWLPKAFSQIASRELARRERKYPRNHHENLKGVETFQKVNQSGLSRYIDYKIKVTRDDERQFIGKLSGVSRDQVWLILYTAGGNAKIPLYRSRIRRVEVFKVVSE